MKKKVTLLAVLFIFLFLLSSCDSYRAKYDTCHPTKQPMSKWVGDCVEIYVLGSGRKSIMIVDYGVEKIHYLIYWHGDCLTRMSIRDCREAVSVLDEPDIMFDSHQSIANWQIELIDETCFKLKGHREEESEGECEIPELMLQKDITMTRVATDLTEADIPQIEVNDDYNFCPAYRYDSQWISDDNQVSICMLGNGGAGEVTFATNPDTKSYVRFFEANSKCYLIKRDNKSWLDISPAKFKNASEEWKCQYSEKCFTAEVVRSEYYESGHILTFSLVETPQISKE